MPDSHLDVYLHFVWATKHRKPMIPEHLEPELYAIIRSEVNRLRCRVLAIGGMADHVHLLVIYGRSVTLGRLMNQIKGVSSRFINEKLYSSEEISFRWQPGYGVFSVSLDHVDTVTQYIENQKQHHKADKIWSRWEEIPTFAENDEASHS